MKLEQVMAAHAVKVAHEAAKKDREFEANYRKCHTEIFAKEINVYHDFTKEQITFCESHVSISDIVASDKNVDIMMSNGGTLRLHLENEDGKIESYVKKIEDISVFIDVTKYKVVVLGTYHVFYAHKSGFKISYKPLDNDWVSII